MRLFKCGFDSKASGASCLQSRISRFRERIDLLRLCIWRADLRPSAPLAAAKPVHAGCAIKRQKLEMTATGVATIDGGADGPTEADLARRRVTALLTPAADGTCGGMHSRREMTTIAGTSAGIKAVRILARTIRRARWFLPVLF